jgi:hypothetical protein
MDTCDIGSIFGSALGNYVSKDWNVTSATTTNLGLTLGGIGGQLGGWYQPYQWQNVYAEIPSAPSAPEEKKGKTILQKLREETERFCSMALAV